MYLHYKLCFKQGVNNIPASIIHSSQNDYLVMRLVYNNWSKYYF